MLWVTKSALWIEVGMVVFAEVREKEWRQVQSTFLCMLSSFYEFVAITVRVGCTVQPAAPILSSGHSVVGIDM
jgi:hypothetical protein